MRRKSDIRRSALARRDALSPLEIRRRSEAASSRLTELGEFQRARTVVFFLSFGSEIDTLPAVRAALASGTRVAAPRADPDSRGLQPCEIRDIDSDLAPGAYGIREPVDGCRPVPADEIDAVLVPAAVWGEDGYRIGYGGGYYDRFLRKVPRAVRIGFGLEVQVLPQVPHEEHDLPVDVLVTDTKVRRFTRRR